MSLSRILNNDPTPPLASNSTPLAAPGPQHVTHAMTLSTNEPLRSSHTPSSVSATPIRGNESTFENGGSANLGAQMHVHRQASESLLSDHEHVDEESRVSMQLETSQTPAKRRKKQAVDVDYQPGTRRSSRRTSARFKRPRTDSPAVNDENDHVISHPDEPTDDTRRLTSSDLEDCAEITSLVEIVYAKETQKRRNITKQLVERSYLDKNVDRVHRYTTLYTETADRIPLPPRMTASIRRPHELTASVSITSLSVDPDYNDYNDHNMPPSFGHATPIGNDVGREKRPASRPASATESSDDDAATVIRSTKKRKMDDTDESQSVASAALTPAHSSQQLEYGEVPNGTPRGYKKLPAKRKFIETLGPGAAEHLGVPESTSQFVVPESSPSGSRAASPAPTVASGIILELDDIPAPLKKAKKVDDVTMLKRVRQLEEMQAKIWKNIVRKDIPKVYKISTTGHTIRQQALKKIATLASTQSRKPYQRTPKILKEAQAKGKKLARDMSTFWKKNDKEERELRRKEHKETLERARAEEEKREATRQARKLEFLISQTELYSHFVGNKLKTAEIEGEAGATELPKGADLEDDPQAPLAAIDFNDDDQTNLHRHARRIAQDNVAQARARAQQFDANSALERKTKDAMRFAKAQSHLHDEPETQEGDDLNEGKPIVDLDSDELNFQNPDALKGPLKIGQPRLLMATLKEYQLKGLNWLGTLYDQGINGILADEMGLGKTIQSISLLAYLAETHNIWGPFLVVAPASTLHNWQQEVSRFVPNLKVLPYWGSVKDRTTLRKFWAKKDITYNKDSDFHIIVTSYQLVTQDQQYFQKVTWQYMILDEAQNIKNSASARWKTLLEFRCRNRLLLTGTPIQNSMQELWSLLHFIMPTLFDSHDEFNEWFSKDIENAADSKGRGLSEHQLRRLHMILKPFMLRRVKKHVQNELSDKIEIDVLVELSARQRQMYRTLLQNISIADLVAQGPSINEAEYKRTLTNLIMQFRKVCNHPELFDRADVVAPFSFAHFGRSGPLNREGDFVVQSYSTRNPIQYSIPRLFYNDGGLVRVPREGCVSPLQPENSVLRKLMNIWTPERLLQSLHDTTSSSYSFLRFANTSPQDAHNLYVATPFRRRLLALQQEATHLEEDVYSGCDFGPMSDQYRIPGISIPLESLADGLPSLRAIGQTAWFSSCLSRSITQGCVPAALAPAVTLYIPDRNFVEQQERLLDAPIESLALYGIPQSLRDMPSSEARFAAAAPGVSLDGLLARSTRDQLPISTMRMPQAKSLILDSGKLARMDALLQELKSNDHRVLIYFQMTRMMDLMEEYLIHRQYKYLRLDGSTKIEDRRDMVTDWQTREDIFIFILSTKAGGLGINLTAADTVIFYDHDWNPSNDAQAMDRAHRLGQTRQVTVYRLICRGSIDERIVQLARRKKDVQDMVVGNKSFTEMNQTNEMVQLLLTDEQIAAAANAPVAERSHGQFGGGGAGIAGLRDLWVEEGDEFFGTTSMAPMVDDEGTPAPSASRARGRGRPRGSGEGRTRARGRGRGRGKKADAE